MADERDVSRMRRELHGRIDQLRSEHTRRLKERQGAVDVDPAIVSEELLTQVPAELTVQAGDDPMPGTPGTCPTTSCASAFTSARRASGRSPSGDASCTGRSTCCAPRSWRACAIATGRSPSTSPRATSSSSRRSSRIAALLWSCRPSSSGSTDRGMYCPECGMQNPEAAHYCARCGVLLLKEAGSTQTMLSFPLESDTDTSIPAVGDVQAGGPALV